MLRAVLLGHSLHEVNGSRIYVQTRDGKYLARWRTPTGKFQSETLDTDKKIAETRLIELMHELNTGTFVPRKQRSSRLQASKTIPKLTLRELSEAFLQEKRNQVGQKTARDYCNRLSPVLDFAERRESKANWPLAESIDRDFALALRVFLQKFEVTPNGKLGGTRKIISQTQLRNCLETLSMVLRWGARADVRKLSPDFVSPITKEIVGDKPAKDPLRRPILEIGMRMRILEEMDNWQFLNLVPYLILPLRHDEGEGLLISDIDWKNRRLQFGTRFGGADFTKGKQDWKLPFPSQLYGVLQKLVSGRSSGPVFLSSKSRRKPVLSADSLEQIESLVEERIATGAKKRSSFPPNDQKTIVRRLLQEMGE